MLRGLRVKHFHVVFSRTGNGQNNFFAFVCKCPTYCKQETV